MSETGAIPDLEDMAHRLAIQEVLATHSRGVDRADEAILKSCYWPDAEVAYGGFNGSAWQFCEMLPQSIRHFAATQHSISNVLVQRDGDLARVETYITAYHYLADADGGDSEMTFLGRYLDLMQRRGDCWKIQHRRVLMDWNQNVAATAVLTGPPFDGLARGARHPDDPLYAHLAVD